MTDIERNADLAYRVLDFIEAHPDQYEAVADIAWVDSDGYHVTPGRGKLLADFGGWTCMLSGELPRILGGAKDSYYSGHVVTADGLVWDTTDRAATLLGLLADVEDSILCYEEVDTLDKLRAAVHATFGPRGGQR